MRDTSNVFLFNQLSKDERDRLSADESLWESEPRFLRYADITNGKPPGNPKIDAPQKESRAIVRVCPA